MRSLLLASLAFLSACAPSTPPPERGAELGGGETIAPPRSPRDLASDATFAQLCDAAREQDRLRDQDSDAGCLLRRRPGAFRLEADLAVAVRPLPEAEADLDPRMASTAPLRVLTRYGAYGTSAEMGLVALTTTAPPRGAIEDAVGLVLVLTDRGVYARRTDAPFGAASPAPLSEVLASASVHEVSTIFVTAEAGLPLDGLFSTLAALPPELAGHVALASALPEGVALPERPTLDPGPPAPLCDGIAETDEPWSETVSGPALLERVASIRGSLALCVGASTGPGARGGRMELMVRLTRGGGVAEACIRADSTDDEPLRACILRVVRELTFPDPAGQVIFAVPLVLEPGTAHAQTAVCAD
jgi:hypothetical protein